MAPLGIEVLQAVARVNDPDAIVWRGDPTQRGEDEGVRILGTAREGPHHSRAWLLLLLLRRSGKLHPLSGPLGDRRFRSPPRRSGLLLPAFTGIWAVCHCVWAALGSATLLSRPAFWASWADCFPEQMRDVDMEPGIPRHRRQRTATEPVHGVLIEGTVRPKLSATEKAMFRSQRGPLAGIPFLCFPTSVCPACVAVHLTPVVTIVQLARRQGCWVVEGSLWKAPPLGCVAKPVLVCPQMCS